MADFNLQDQIQYIQDLSTYHIPNEIDVADDPSSIERAVEALAENSDAITDPEIFDIFRSVLKQSDALRGVVLSKTLDSLSSGFIAEAEATQTDVDTGADPHQCLAHKTPLEVYAFLVLWFVIAAEKFAAGGKETEDVPPAAKPKRGRGAKKAAASSSRNVERWSWADQIPQTLALLSKILRLSTHKIWTTTAERDTFVNCVTRPAYHIMESELYMKNNDIKMGVYKIICLAVKHHGHGFGAQISIMQCLQYFEHLAEPMAEVLTVLSKEFDHSQLAEEILREISSKSFNGQDTKGPRSFSRFLIRLADLAPRLILKQFALLLAHLDSEAYPMRVALVEIIGVLVKEISSEEDEVEGRDNRERKINGLFELLLERFLDLSSYVRVKVLNTLGKLWDLRIKFPKQRQEATVLVIAALEDKASSVRRYAIVLLTKMILTHPYGMMYGGTLSLGEWEKRYEDIAGQLKAAEGKETGKPDEEEDPEKGGDEVDEEEEKGGDEDEDEEDEDEEDGDGDGEEEDEVEGEVKAENDDDEDDDLDASPKPKRSGKGKKVKKEPGGSPSKKADKKAKSKRSKAKPRKSEFDLAAVSQEQAIEALDLAQITRLRLTKRYLTDALSFIRQIHGASDVLCQLLASTSKAEVLESMEFFKVAHEYQLEIAEVGIKRMVHLIWTKDNTTVEDGKELKGIRSRLIECYRALYFEAIPDAEPKQQVNRIAKNMIELTYDATLAELTSLEELMRTMMDDRQIHSDVITKLWQVYSVDKDIPKAQRRGAIIILGMLALAKREIVTERIETLLKVGLGSLGKADLTLARYTCVALQRISGSAKKIKGSLADTNMRLAMDNPIFSRLRDAIEHPCQSKDWFGMAEQAINTIYLLGEQPDILCNSLIKNFTTKVFRARPKSTPPKDAETVESTETAADAEASVEAGEDTTTQGEATPAPKGDVGDAFHLSQLVFIVGHVAIKHIVYLELVERELKRRKDEAAKDKQRNKDSTKGNKDGEELDQVAGNAEDDIGDVILGIRERELLYGPQSLLAVFGPLIVHICGSPKKYKNQTLRTAATLSLSKLMCVSSHFCEENLLLLFKILETSRDPTIRSNIVIALGDVAVCFSNMIDENSHKLYEGLSDKNLVVKKHTLMVLTHLILNGMVKVKGQLGEMAKCLEDEDSRIADLAKLFFTELSTKDNAIYNNLPDVISHLSVGEHAVSEEVFQSTMKYMFSFIEKDKQAENIVDKLCQRFRLTNDERQWRDIAYCLSLLPFKSERSMKKLIEGLPAYQDKLHEETVFMRFNEILTKARANKSANKPDTELKEFEAILKDFKEKGEEDQALEQDMQAKTAAAKKKATKRSSKYSR
ncbi:hypothetical protein BOTBODRAFT_179302 [Botryobasidium botryosum FD-172 SS1]|uniref:Condensin complex subunit 1 n=1 Tax=Botryobasidium botryosum (strain FD-172 SS1) TaxID=930990 RepID=A0A067MC04_BOTB1|nr:hypothetical protein BOTBODRAFT_179302 [Botryobasidium botryosum FD-172 SS1]